jgi:hypothetical protein
MVDDSVRRLIREVLAEELRRMKAETAPMPGVHEEAVSIGSDADLAVFVAKLMKLAGDAKARRDIEQGRVVFRLAGQGQKPSGSAAEPAAPAGDTVRMERGVVSERQVDALPKGTRILRAGKDVKLTPLAKDRLRHRGIKIERTG